MSLVSKFIKAKGRKKKVNKTTRGRGYFRELCNLFLNKLNYQISKFYL